MSIWLQWAIIVFIALGIGFVVWRHGTANPEGTGRVGKELNDVSKKVVALNGRIGFLESEIEELKREGATVKDVARLEERMATIRAEIAGHREVSQRTGHSVDRIERLLIEKGLGK